MSNPLADLSGVLNAITHEEALANLSVHGQLARVRVDPQDETVGGEA
jgi:hypothetical protein